MANKVRHSFWIQSSLFHSFKESFLPRRQSVKLKFESVFCQQLCIVIKQNKKLKTNNSGTVSFFFFTNHHISWQWADGNPSTLCFCSKWSEWHFRITLRSRASFFSFFSCFLERACTSFLVFELILIFPIFFKKVMYISKALYIAEKRSTLVLIWWPLESV